MKVDTTPDVKQYLNDLITILYENGYFSYEEDAKQYVDDLLLDIETNLTSKSHKPATPYFDKYGTGMYYASFKKNKKTTWYAFFTKYLVNGETIYLVRYINNNHMIAQYL